MKIDMSKSKEIFGEEAQLAAVKVGGYAIQYIDNPSEAVQMATVLAVVDAIRYIDNPTEAVQMATVRQNGCAIVHIRNPSEAVMQAALHQDGNAIQLFKRSWLKNIATAEELTVEELEKRLGYRIKIVSSSRIPLAADATGGTASA